MCREAGEMCIRDRSMEWLTDRRINHGVHQIVCDKCVNNFADIADIWHGKQQNGCNCIGECEPQDPDTGFAVLGMGSVDDLSLIHIFLGAGVIFKHGNTIKGLTTAAGIWATAGIGLAIGSGMFVIGIFTTVVVAVLQIVMHRIVVRCV